MGENSVSKVLHVRVHDFLGQIGGIWTKRLLKHMLPRPFVNYEADLDILSILSTH